jgi:DNA polymerase
MGHVSNRKVPHIGPEDADIFIVGEAPGNHEDVALQPFVGPSGDLLNLALEQAGLDRESIRIGNVLNYQPVNNVFQHANTTWQLEESRKELYNYMRTAKHKVVVAMGRHAMEFFTGHTEIEKRRGSVYQLKNGIYVIPTIHPAAVLRDGSHTVGFLHDLIKAARVAREGWQEPKFNFITDPDQYQVESLIPILTSAERLWCDIETRKYTNYIRCMGFAWSPTDAVCLWNDSHTGIGPNFTRWLRMILGSPAKKTFHNGMFDTRILKENGIFVENWDYDTMLAQHSIQPELPLGLDYCTSIYTDINYYKDDGKETSNKTTRESLAVYNCKDVVATCQVHLAQLEEMDEVSWKMFQNKWIERECAEEISDCGLLIDTDRQKELKERVEALLHDAYVILYSACSMHNVEPFRVAQHSKVKDFLYKTLALPIKTNKEGAITADEDALVSLIATCRRRLDELKTEPARTPWIIRLGVLRAILKIRGYEKMLSSYINVTPSPDGRVRSIYNVTGTETTRWSASSWYDRSGLNAQTIPREYV